MTTIQITTNKLRNKELFLLHTILNEYQDIYRSDFTYNSEYIWITDEFPKRTLAFLYKVLNNLITETYDEFKYITLD